MVSCRPITASHFVRCFQQQLLLLWVCPLLCLFKLDGRQDTIRFRQSVDALLIKQNLRSTTSFANQAF